MSVWQHVADMLAGGRWRTPGDLARTIDPARMEPVTGRMVGTVQTPALDLIDAAIVETLSTPDGRLIITMPPQEGKSMRAGIITPIWALTRDKNLRIAVGSYGQRLANRNGRAIRDRIAAHPELGLSIAHDNGSISEWKLAGHDGGVYAVGRGGAITGQPVDLLIIDDPIKDRQEADSLVIRDNCWDWWTDSLSTRLAPGAAVILIQTRWHHDDLAGRLTAAEDGHVWRVVNIPAQADHQPAKGQADVLGRDVGEWLTSARGRTAGQWQATKVRVGSRTWASLYQGRPTAIEGGMVKRHWWKYYDQPQWVELDDGSRRTIGMDQVIISADLTFKGDDSSDYVAIGVWGRRGPQAFLLDQIRGHFDFPETTRRLEAICARWPEALLKLIEDKANGPAVIASLRQKIPGLVGEIPQGGKEARVAAVSPLIEAGGTLLPAAKLAPWVEGYVDEWAAFPNGAHDDQVDQSTQALNRLILQPLLDNEQHEDDPTEGFTIVNY